jgi:methyltransferase (TIGR00027 family)
MRVFEVDRPGPQAWKRERLTELGYGVPPWLRLVPVDFEADGSWWDRLVAAGFDVAEPAVVASLGVSMYLTKEANAATLRQLASLAPGSTLIMTFAPPLDLLDEQARAGRLTAENGARASGTPWLSSFAPQEILALARQAGFKDASYVSAAMLNDRYFAARTDHLRTAPGEELLVATT